MNDKNKLNKSIKQKETGLFGCPMECHFLIACVAVEEQKENKMRVRKGGEGSSFFPHLWPQAVLTGRKCLSAMQTTFWRNSWKIH